MHFFHLDAGGDENGQPAQSSFFAAAGTAYDDAPKCAVCGEFTGMLRWRPPIRIELETWGSSYPDIVRAGASLLLSQRFIEAWKQAALIGLPQFVQAEITRTRSHRKMKHPRPAYHLAALEAGSTAINLSESEFVNGCEVCPVCRLGDELKRWKRIVIEDSTWGGEDIFVARGLPGAIFVTSNVVEMVDRHKLLNARVTHSESYARDFYPWELRPK